MTERADPAAAGGGFRTRVVVKFRDHVQLPYDGTAAEHVERAGVGPWAELSARFKGLTLEPLFGSQKPEVIRKLVDRAKENDPTYRPGNLLTYYAVTVPAGVSADEVVKELSRWRSVAQAYVEPGPVEPPYVNPADDPRSVNQGYLDPAPDGIDAEYAWGFPGGDGAGQALVDLEWGWTLHHEDLAAHGITLISGVNHSYFFHGSGVLGEIAAVDNAVGCVGIVPALASVRCVGQHRAGGGYSTVDPILDALTVMTFGDVLLLEAQTELWGYTDVPVEIEPAVFEVVRLATALGVIVVEAGGNGGIDLDTVTTPGGQLIFNRASADFLDSGAIIVGAASSAAPHARLGFSCHGSRIDCYAWGENVTTLSADDTNTATDRYTATFDGTSSASPIITGAALAVQGLAQANLGHRFGPRQMRVILSDPATGTASATPSTDRIGVMPNLRAIIAGAVLNLAPDVYLRDFVGDTGDPHTGAISASPDVILRKVAVADPTAAFGEGSGTESSNTLGDAAEAGQDNFVYVRVRNRGGSAANGVTATVFWAPPATLLTPDLWTLIGTTTLPAVPTGNLLTVSNAVTWPAAAIPAPGHYCLVALIGHPADPAPAPADFLNWDNFRAFVRTQNNVTWRNFNVVDNVPPVEGVPPDYVPLSFLAAGAPDKARRMTLEVVARLPRGAKAVLEMPAGFAELLQVRSVKVEGAKNPAVAYAPVNPHGRTTFGPVAFPAKARIPMRLMVHVPPDQRKYDFEVYARQLFAEEEVGRVTWRLTGKKK